MTVCIELPRSGSYDLMMPALDIKTELFGVLSRKDAK